MTLRKITYFIFIVIAILIFLGSCVSEKKRRQICATCPVKDSVSVKDSSWTKIKYVHDTSYISIPGPTITLQNPCAHLCDSAGKLKQFSQEGVSNGIKTRIYTDVKNDKLIEECNADSIQKLLDSVIVDNNRLRSSDRTITLPPIEVNRLTKFQSFMYISGIILWILLVLYFGIKYGIKVLKMLIK